MKYIFLENESDRYTQRDDIIQLVKDNWDDYGSKVSLILYYKGEFLGSLRLLKIDSTNVWESLEKDQLVNKILDEELDNHYYSLATQEIYKKLYSLANSAEEVQDFLGKFRDIAFNKKLIGKKLKEDISYKNAFLRGINEQYIENALEKATLNIKTGSYTMKVSYNTMSDYFTFKFDPERRIPANLNVIIGNNGVGKSRFLRDVALAAAHRENTIESEFVQSDKLPEVSLESSDDSEFFPNNIVYISLSPFDSPSKEFEEYINKLKDKNKADKTILNYFELLAIENRGQSVANLWENLVELLDRSVSSNISLRQRTLNIIKDNFSWDRNFAELIGLIEYSLRVGNNPEELRKNKESLRSQFKKLSSGQKEIIIILLVMVENIIENSLFIIDEPENFLHPPYIAALVKSISESLKHVNGAGIMATHSDVTVQGIPTSCVYILDENQKLNQLKGFQTYGASLDDINENIFGLDMEKNGFYKEIRKFVSELEKGDIREEYQMIDGLFDGEGLELGSAAKLYLWVMLENIENGQELQKYLSEKEEKK
ncbi:AAA family ATPase [Limosilactobacillus agrestis]|uniref:AAA family ATPase n=1 Tax=Limosilactobacillus agrestis TaxID=2759748 RepID=UPI001E3F07F0|nr:AAA family ATPase [Limosilactobacillus agrestis]MCD7113680.1 ATP-binding protein [Limosilactobacillus agrestis]